MNARREVERMLRHGRPLSQVERRIDAMPIDGEHKAALWLLAWSAQNRNRPRLR